MAAADMAPRLVAEFVGTFLLVFTIGCNVLGQSGIWAGVSIACALMVAIYSLGDISGANFNPAVSVSIAISTAMKGPGDMDWTTCMLYCCAQLLGGITAAFSYAALFWNAFNLGPTKDFGGLAGALSAGLCETLYTFMLCFVVLNVAVAKKPRNDGFGLAIGFVIVAGAYGAGAISGGCFNPAVAIGIDTLGSHSSNAGFGWCLVYTFFELIGAAVAAVAFRFVRPGDFDAEGSALRSKLISEFLGTFMLVLTVGLNVLGNSPAGAFSIAASLMCMIYALGDVSGAHFNPAVTLAVFASKMTDLSIKDAGMYMLVQVLGGVVAAMTYSLIYAPSSHNTFPLGPQEGHHMYQVAVAEIIFSFVLCYVVLCTAVAHKTKTDMCGLAIGSCVTVGGFAIGSISGGSLNPAVSIGISSSQMLNAGMFLAPAYNALMYTGFEFAGAAAAAGLVMVTHPEKKPSLGI